MIGAVALTASGTAMANGFYAGGGIGMLNLNNKTTLTQQEQAYGGGYGDVPAMRTTTTTDNGSKLGVNGTLMAGYAWTFPNRLFTAVEAFGNYTSAKISENTTTSTLATASSLRLTYVYGARVLPGFQVTPDSVAYGILGVARVSISLANTRS